MNKKQIKGDAQKSEKKFTKKTLENLKEISALALERPDGILKTTDICLLNKLIK